MSQLQPHQHQHQHQHQPSSSFAARKTHILARLSVPRDEYSDASPKGRVDEGIRELIDDINRVEGLATTSSCAGRVSVFVEGKKEVGGGDDGDDDDDDDDDDKEAGGEDVGSGAGWRSSKKMKKKRTRAGIGGKGGGGTWQFVSHDVLGDVAGEGWATKFGFAGRHGATAEPHDDICAEDGRERRLIRFKFEPMVSFEREQTSKESQGVYIYIYI